MTEKLKSAKEDWRQVLNADFPDADIERQQDRLQILLDDNSGLEIQIIPISVTPPQTGTQENYQRPPQPNVELGKRFGQEFGVTQPSPSGASSQSYEIRIAFPGIFGDDDRAVMAALKYLKSIHSDGPVSVTGDEAFKQRVHRLALIAGVKVRSHSDPASRRPDRSRHTSDRVGAEPI
jgi:hypothetical protein